VTIVVWQQPTVYYYEPATVQMVATYCSWPASRVEFYFGRGWTPGDLLIAYDFSRQSRRPWHEVVTVYERHVEYYYESHREVVTETHTIEPDVIALVVRGRVRMDRRQRKLERDRRRGKERQARARLRREAEARRPKFEHIPPSDLRGLSAVDWADYTAVNFETVVERAREMYPRDALLRRFVGRRIGGDMRDVEATRLAQMLTLAARTLRSDPPWHWPCVHWRRDPEVVHHLRWRRTHTSESTDHGTLDCWGLELPGPTGAPTRIWFPRHAVERFLERTALTAAVERRLYGDAWLLVFADAPAGVRTVIPMEIVERDGETVLRLSWLLDRSATELGRFPLELADGRAVAKTFLEPWMEGPSPPVRYSAAEREAFRERHVREVLPQLLDQLGPISARLAGAEFFDAYQRWLVDTYFERRARDNDWLYEWTDAHAAFKAKRYREARGKLDRCLAGVAEMRTGYHPTWELYLSEPAGREVVMEMHFLRAQICSMEAAGTLDGGTPVPPDAAEAARLMALGLEHVALGVKENPSLIEFMARSVDVDVVRLREALGRAAK